MHWRDSVVNFVVLSAAMLVLTEKDELVLAEVEEGVSKKWKWSWLERYVKVSHCANVCYFRLSKFFQKINKPGIAQCSLCNGTEINYSNWGVPALLQHAKSKSHSKAAVEIATVGEISEESTTLTSTDDTDQMTLLPAATGAENYKLQRPRRKRSKKICRVNGPQNKKGPRNKKDSRNKKGLRNKKLRITSVKSCAKKKSAAIRASADNSVKYQNVSLLESSEKMKALLDSEVVTMPQLMDSHGLSDENLKILKQNFLEFPYPTSQKMKRLSSATSLKLSFVKGWFAKMRVQNGVSWNPEEVRDAMDYLKDEELENTYSRPKNDFLLHHKATPMVSQPFVTSNCLCSVCTREVGPNSLQCCSCSKRVHFGCTSLPEATLNSICFEGSAIGWVCPACSRNTPPPQNLFETFPNLQFQSTLEATPV